MESVTTVPWNPSSPRKRSVVIRRDSVAGEAREAERRLHEHALFCEEAVAADEQELTRRIEETRTRGEQYEALNEEIIRTRTRLAAAKASHVIEEALAVRDLSLEGRSPGPNRRYSRPARQHPLLW